MQNSSSMLSNKSIFILLMIIALSVLILSLLIIFIDSGKKEKTAGYHFTDPDLIEGHRLSTIYCSSCHRFPEPGLLPKSTWESETLPAMGPFLGIFEHQELQYSYPDNRSQLQYIPDDYYPSEQQLSSDEWQKILDFYIQAAPEYLPDKRKDPEIITDSLFFTSRLPNFKGERPPIVTSVKFDPEYRQLYISDGSENNLMVFDENLELINRFDITSPVVNIEFISSSEPEDSRLMLLTYIGHLDPSDAPLGSVKTGWYLPEASDVADMHTNTLFDNLTRPVESKLADMNGNGREDLLVAEFGHRTGKFSWFENLGNGYRNEPNILVDAPGCIQSYILDVTDNGLNDIIVLCTQLDQSIYLLKNMGNGEFNRQTLLEFSITAGSSSIELYDMNGNGYPDIIYTSGDNADYSKTYKPYHGVYIFTNDGDYNFTEEWFYPVNGAYRAIARDFDGDGNPDIAVIAYFNDYNRYPEEGFLFFKNQGGLNFTPYHHPAASTGRWITMDVADFTGNGFDDILLGNFPYGPSLDTGLFQRRWDESPLFLLLENRTDLMQ
jgi:hypothetical protein